MRILIIEDEISILKLLEYDLKQLQFQVDTALDGSEGYQKAKEGNFDVIVLDLMLPGMNGLEICKKLRKNNVESHIIMLTAMDEEYQKIDGFDAGADDYITKPFSPRELSARIKALERRLKKKQSQDCLEFGNLKVMLGSYEVLLDNQKIDVTLKEFELLEALLLNKGNVLSREQLLTKLWGYDYDGDTRVVDVHIFKLREKIPLLQEGIKTVRGIGYKLI